VPVEGNVGLAISVIMRVVIKTVVDYTGVVQFRSPLDVGGLHWTLNLAFNYAAAFVIIPLFFKSSERSSAVSISQDDAFVMASNTTLAAVVTFTSFIFLMKSEYRSSFWSTERGASWPKKRFLQGENDAVRASVFEFNKGMWKEIAPQVEDWVRQGWREWQEERPPWFTDHWKAEIPEEWVPIEGKYDHKQARRNSLSLHEGIFGRDTDLSLAGDDDTEARGSHPRAKERKASMKKRKSAPRKSVVRLLMSAVAKAEVSEAAKRAEYAMKAKKDMEEKRSRRRSIEKERRSSRVEPA
jgi:hypothetical protein